MTPSPKPADFLERAQQKQANGFGTTNSEKRAIKDFAAGKIGKDHFAAISTTPVKLPTAAPKDAPAHERKHLASEDVDGLQAALRKIGNGDQYTEYTFTACVSGVPKTFVIPIVSGPT